MGEDTLNLMTGSLDCLIRISYFLLNLCTLLLHRYEVK